MIKTNKRWLPQLTLLLSTVFLAQTQRSPTNQIFSRADILQSSTEYQHKFPISIEDQFSNQSDMTVVVTSCSRFNQLQMTLNSFFHFNSYILNKIIIIEDCYNPAEIKLQELETQIWEVLPHLGSHYPQFFQVIINQNANGGKLGQIGSIDRAYKQVTTKYVYHLEDDWIQLSGYGMLERMRDSLVDAQHKNIKVSQVVQTVPNWGYSHFRGPLQWTEHNTKYYTVTSYGKTWLYSFSFNPHLLDFEQIYIKQLNGSLTNSITKRYHCWKQNNNEEMQDAGCTQHYLGVYLSEKGYKQVYMEENLESEFRHIGTPEYQKPEVYQFEFQVSTQNKSITKQQQNSNNEPLIHKQQQQNNTSHPLLPIILILLIVLIAVYIRTTNKNKQPKQQTIQPSQEETALK